MKKLFIIALTFTLFLIGCKKNKSTDLLPTPSSTGVVIAKEVNVISNQIWNDNIISLDSTSFTITFKKGITSTQQIKAGDIIATAVGEGLLRKVKSVSIVNNEIKVETEFAALTDCIKQGIIDINQPLTINHIKRIDYHYEGIKLKTNKFKSGGNEPVNLDINTMLYDLDGNKSTTADQIKLIGSLTCDWGFNLKIDVGLSEGLKEVNFGVTGSENLDLQLIAGIQYSFKKEISLATVHFAPIYTTIGVLPLVFPIVISPQLEIYIGIDGSANAAVTSRITQRLSFENGIKFIKAQGWSAYKNFDKNFYFQPPQLNVNASASAYLKPEFLLKIDYVAGPYANMKIYSRLDADLLQTPWWKLYGGIKMSAGAKVNIVDRFTLDYIVSDLINDEILLAQSTTPPILLPSVTTNAITNITQTTANSGGNIISDGGEAVTARGVCWSTLQTPSIANDKTNDGSGVGSFTSSLHGLTANTTYFVRAYAVNSAGTTYGSEISFKTSASGSNSDIIFNPNLTYGSVTDIDGNVYKTIKIGTQTWMAENLKTTKYQNGDPIPKITDNTTWAALTTGAYCWYNNDINNKTTYGALYNWFTVNNIKKIAPLGWHVATDAEWTKLTNYLGGESVAGDKLKEVGVAHWQSPNVGATNESGFTALPSGGRKDFAGTSYALRDIGFWWSSSADENNTDNAGSPFLGNTASLFPGYSRKQYGFSVRCIKD